MSNHSSSNRFSTKQDDDNEEELMVEGAVRKISDDVTDGHNDSIDTQQDIIGSAGVALHATSSPVNIGHSHTSKYAILPEEYSIIEGDHDHNITDTNLDAAFDERMRLDDDDDDFDSLPSSFSSSSSTASLKRLLESARQMITNYPSEEELAHIFAENMINHMVEMYHADVPPHLQQYVNHSDDSVILLESQGVQTSFSFEPEEEEDGSENMEQ